MPVCFQLTFFNCWLIIHICVPSMHNISVAFLKELYNFRPNKKHDRRFLENDMATEIRQNSHANKRGGAGNGKSFTSFNLGLLVNLKITSISLRFWTLICALYYII